MSEHKWVFWLISILQTVVLGVSAWVLLTLVALMPEIRGNQIKADRNERDIERVFNVVELLDSKIDVSTADRFNTSDAKLMEARLNAELREHKEDIEQNRKAITDLRTR